jgi:hypothetical protein
MLFLLIPLTHSGLSNTVAPGSPRPRPRRHIGSMPDRKTNRRKPVLSHDQVTERADRRFAAADGQIADIKEKGAEARRKIDRSTTESDV